MIRCELQNFAVGPSAALIGRGGRRTRRQQGATNSFDFFGKILDKKYFALRVSKCTFLTIPFLRFKTEQRHNLSDPTLTSRFHQFGCSIVTNFVDSGVYIINI